MPIFQRPPVTPAEIEASRPLDIPPEEVAKLDEDEWYARAYRGDAPQLTLRAVLMGSALGLLLSFTNIYVGLKTGWSLTVVLTAAIAGFASWSLLLRVGLAKTPMSILETNCMQSVASSAGYATGIVLVSAVPAMLLLTGKQLHWTVAGPFVIACALLGVTMAIPMKRNMINRERLKFPSGTAAAVLLQSLYGNGREALLKARALGISGAIAFIVPLLKDLNARRVVAADGSVTREPLFPDTWRIFDWMGHIHARVWNGKTQSFEERVFQLSDWHLRLDHSLVLIAAGAIVGIRATFAMVLGGAVQVFVIGPRAIGATWVNTHGDTVAAIPSAAGVASKIGIWYGAPILVAYGLVTFALQWRMIARALGGLSGSKTDERAAAIEPPMTWFVRGTLVSGLALVMLSWRYFDIPIHYGILAVVMTFLLGLVACRATGETDITPGGPLGKIMQLTYGVLMPQNAQANLMTAAITSGAGLASADLLNDLKSGYLLGANPRRQFLAQLSGIVTGAIGSTIAYYVLVPNVDAIRVVDANHPPPFTAPAAQQWEAVARVFTEGIANLHPMARHAIAIGVSVGVVLALAEAWFPKRKSFIPSATGLGLGLLLPAFQPLSFFLGAALAWLFFKLSAKNAERFVIPISSGVIAGESVVGVVVQALNNFVLK